VRNEVQMAEVQNTGLFLLSFANPDQTTVNWEAALWNQELPEM
jgi:hypothetical protein